MGDVVLISPLVRCLKQQLNAELHFVTKAAFAPILESNPYVDKVWALSATNYTQLEQQLKAEDFDLVLDLHHNLRSLRLSLAIGKPTRRFPKRNIAKWLLVNFKWNTLPATEHVVHRYMQTAQHLGVKYDNAGLDYFIPTDTQVDNLPQSPFWALVIGAAHATKQIPEHKLAEIIEKSPFHLALLGGKAELALAQALTSRFPAKCINYCGQLSIHGSAFVIQQANLVITPDTGMMHIAAALKRPIVSVWGNTVPALGMWPFYPAGMELEKRLEVLNLPCRPCSKIGYAACPKGHFKCMEHPITHIEDWG